MRATPARRKLPCMIRRLWKALTRNAAETRQDAADARLRGRVYDLPFARVWQAVLHTAGSLPGWRVTHADPARGLLRAEDRTTVFRFTDEISVHVRLDDEGRTRVDARSASRVGRADFGANARRLHRFLRALDRRLAEAAAEPAIR